MASEKTQGRDWDLGLGLWSCGLGAGEGPEEDGVFLLLAPSFLTALISALAHSTPFAIPRITLQVYFGQWGWPLTQKGPGGG